MNWKTAVALLSLPAFLPAEPVVKDYAAPLPATTACSASYSGDRSSETDCRMGVESADSLFASEVWDNLPAAEEWNLGPAFDHGDSTDFHAETFQLGWARMPGVEHGDDLEDVFLRVTTVAATAGANHLRWLESSGSRPLLRAAEPAAEKETELTAASLPLLVVFEGAAVVGAGFVLAAIGIQRRRGTKRIRRRHSTHHLPTMS